MSKLNYSRPIQSNRIPITKYDVKRPGYLVLEWDSIVRIGKYKGSKVIDIYTGDFQYLKWMFKNKICLFSLSVGTAIKEECNKKFNELPAEKIKERRERQYTKRKPHTKKDPKLLKQYFIFNEKREEIKQCNGIKEAINFIDCSGQTINQSIRDGGITPNGFYVSRSQILI